MTGAPSWYISRERALPRLSTSAEPSSLPVVSYQRTQLLNLPRGAPATPPYRGTPTPPLVISYRLTQFVDLQGGTIATPPFIGTRTPPPTVFYRCT